MLCLWVIILIIIHKSSVKTFQAKDKNDYILFLISYLLGPIFTIYGYLKIKGYQDQRLSNAMNHWWISW